MNGVIEKGGAPLSPFAIPVSDAPILNVPLARHVEAELASAGVVITEGAGARLVVAGNVFVNASCLRALVEAAGERGGRLVLNAPGYARLAGGEALRAVDVAVVPAGGDGSAAARAALPSIEIDAQETGFDLASGPESLSVAAPRRVAVSIDSWADLLFANLFAMTARVRNMSPWTGMGLVLVAVARAHSINKWRVAGKLVGKGKNCDIHPSAVVEASVLGDGVQIGPGAVVRGSILGDGVEVEELALVTGSVLGERARVQRQGMFRFSVAFPRASVGGGVQLSVFGDGSAIRQGSYTIDRRLDGSAITIATPSGLVKKGPSLGIAVGAGSSIGTGVWIAAGRAIPPGVTLVRSASEVVGKIPADSAPGVYEASGGTFVPRAKA